MLQLRAQTLDSNNVNVNVVGQGHLQISQPGKVEGHPPTLFSHTNNKVSCDGAIARALKYGPVAVSNFLYWEGLALLVIAVLVNMLKLGALCKLDGGLQGRPLEVEQKVAQQGRL